MNTVYIPPVWERDTLGVSALKAVGFTLFMASAYGAVQFLEIMMVR